MTPPSEKSWEIPQPHDFLDWEALRLQSLAPGGFGNARAYIWYPFFFGSDTRPLFLTNVPSGQGCSTYT